MISRTCLIMIPTAVAAAPAIAQGEAASGAGPRVEGIAGYDEGLVYGAGAGYDVRAGSIVLGIEGEIGNSTAESCQLVGPAPGSGSLCERAGRDLYVGGRVGALVSPRTLVYGKLGYTNQRVELHAEGGAAVGHSGLVQRYNLDGVRLGTGIEIGLSKRAYVKGEFRYSDYEGGARKHDGVIGLGYRF